MDQWSAPPLQVASDNPCGTQRIAWPNRTCNIDKGHKGDHCYIKQSGNTVVTLLWKDGE